MKLKRIAAGLCALSMLASCSQNENISDGGNSLTPLVVAYSEFSGKFSPFFAELGYDMDVASMVIPSIMTTDREGGIVYSAIEGETVPFNGTEYTYKGPADISVEIGSTTTTYTIKIRDDIKFSDGEIMDADDIIFTYYVLSDPSYTGSSTIFSTPIQGIKNYYLDNSNAESVSEAEIAEAAESNSDVLDYIAEEIIAATLTSELEWVKSLYGNEEYTAYTEAYPEAAELFAVFYSLDEAYIPAETEEQVLTDIIGQYGYDYKSLGDAYAGDSDYFTAKVHDAALEILLSRTGGESVSRIDGIKKLSRTEVQITTNGFDAAAIYQICGINVAPLHYYGSESLYDYENDKFGFEKGDLSAVSSKTSAPMGWGAYKFVKYENKVVYFEANENYYKGEPKTKYLQFRETAESDKISAVDTGTVDISEPSGSLEGFEEIKSYNSNGELNGDRIVTSAVDNLGYGYIGLNAKLINVGGDSASEESKNLRKAIATVLAVYRDLTIDSFYGDAAKVINYPISDTSWAAPKKTDSDYLTAYSTDINANEIFTADMTADEKYGAALEAALEYFEAAGYTVENGRLTAAPDGAKLGYSIYIGGGGSGDHPTFALVTAAKNAFETIGFTLTINDPADANEMWNSLNAGTAEMWCAAWQATIDPDMYQIYHSSNIIGARGSNSNKYYIQDSRLDSLILEARSSDDKTFRKGLYKECFDLVLSWGVEIPVYQRQNTIIFSAERIKTETVTPDITTYWGWASEIELLEMK